MPHKKAKRSIRDKQRSQKGTDLPPASALASESIPKTVSRVLDAAKIRGEWKEKKRKRGEGGGGNDDGGMEKNKRRKEDGKDSKSKSGKVLGIQPGETLGHFNRRVEDDMRPLVKTAIQSSAATSRLARKLELAENAKNSNSRGKSQSKPQPNSLSPSPPPPPPKHATKPKEFQTHSSSVPRRLNDVAQAPPEFKKLPRGDGKRKEQGTGGIGGKNAGVLSMAQKVMMEEERAKAILRYREMKEKRWVDGGNGSGGIGT